MEYNVLTNDLRHNYGQAHFQRKYAYVKHKKDRLENVNEEGLYIFTDALLQKVDLKFFLLLF